MLRPFISTSSSSFETLIFYSLLYLRHHSYLPQSLLVRGGFLSIYAFRSYPWLNGDLVRDKKKKRKKQRNSILIVAINARWHVEVCVTVGAARPQRQHAFTREPMKIIPSCRIHVDGKGKKYEGSLGKAARDNSEGGAWCSRNRCASLAKQTRSAHPTLGPRAPRTRLRSPAQLALPILQTQISRVDGEDSTFGTAEKELAKKTKKRRKPPGDPLQRVMRQLRAHGRGSQTAAPQPRNLQHPVPGKAVGTLCNS